MKKNNIENLVRQLIIEIGEDPNREGLLKTPARFEKMMRELTSGYKASITKVVNGAIYSQKIHNMIVLKDIEIYSLCEHHLLPFFGKCHIGYIARDKVIGISKIARIVDMYSHRLQLQERLTEEISSSLQSVLKPLGVGVVIEARHLCMMMRGVEKQNSVMVSSAVAGIFQKEQKTREEFLSFVMR